MRRDMKKRLPRMILLAGWIGAVIAVAAPPEPAPFPKANPESQGLSSAALRELCQVVEGYLRDNKIVGAELLVIKNRKTVLHEALGWKDAERRVSMERGTLFNIRSMTKPITGTAAQMLIDQGLLSLSDVAAKYLPAFDNEKSRGITIEHLLTHRSGLPFTALNAGGLKGITDLQDLAGRGGSQGPDFPPGSDFQYSDAGTEALGAIVEKASGRSLEAFFRERILTPLEMRDSLFLSHRDDPENLRASSAYAGQPGAWVRYWSPGDELLYPFALGSQSLYCSLSDYARFLAFWMDGGTRGKTRLLSPEAVRRALSPVSDMEYPTGFAKWKVFYGQMWMLYVDPEQPVDEQVVAFGHNGSDGTYAWAWPKEDLMVLYFTQSRGNTTGIAFEREIERLLMNALPIASSTEEAVMLRPLLGAYHAEHGAGNNPECRVFSRDGGLAVELPQGLILDLLKPDEERIWRFEFAPQQGGLTFERDGEKPASSLWLYQYIECARESAASDEETAAAPEALRPYLGAYTLGTHSIQPHGFKVTSDHGQLALVHPGGGGTRLNDADERGRRQLEGYPREYAEFTRDADGRIAGMKMRTADQFLRGAAPPEPEITRAEVEKFLGNYVDPKDGASLKVIFEDGRLTIKSTATPVPVQLFPPDATGRWPLRLNPAVTISFDEDQTGRVVSFTSHLPDGSDLVRPKVVEGDRDVEGNK